MAWPVSEIGDLLTRVDRREDVYPQSTYRLLGMRSQIGGPFLRETKSGAEISATRLSRVNAGDFIYSRLFAWQGAFGVISSDLDGCYVSNEFPLYSVDDNRLDPRFLSLWFGLPSTQRMVEEDCHGSTPGTRNRFKEGYFEKLLFPLPSLGEQHRIVARVARVASLTESRQRTLAASEAEVAALLRKAFEKTVKDAEWRRMAEVAPLVRRPVDVQPDESYPELGIRSFGRGTFHKPALDGTAVGNKKLYRVEPRDLVFNIVFAWEGAVATAKADDWGRVGSHRFLTCVPNPKTTTVDFLLYFFLSPEGLRVLGDASPGGAGRNRTLGLRKLAEVKVPVPHIEKVRWFDRVQAKAEALRAARAEAEEEVGALAPAMLHDLFEASVDARVDREEAHAG